MPFPAKFKLNQRVLISMPNRVQVRVTSVVHLTSERLQRKRRRLKHRQAQHQAEKMKRQQAKQEQANKKRLYRKKNHEGITRKRRLTKKQSKNEQINNLLNISEIPSKTEIATKKFTVTILNDGNTIATTTTTTATTTTSSTVAQTNNQTSNGTIKSKPTKFYDAVKLIQALKRKATLDAKFMHIAGSGLVTGEEMSTVGDLNLIQAQGLEENADPVTASKSSEINIGVEQQLPADVVPAVAAKEIVRVEDAQLATKLQDIKCLSPIQAEVAMAVTSKEEEEAALHPINKQQTETATVLTPTTANIHMAYETVEAQSQFCLVIERETGLMENIAKNI